MTHDHPFRSFTPPKLVAHLDAVEHEAWLERRARFIAGHWPHLIDGDVPGSCECGDRFDTEADWAAHLNAVMDADGL